MSLYPLTYFGLITQTLTFIGRHFLVVMALCLVAAIGRSLQLGAAGEVNGIINFFLEVIIEVSRVAVFLIALGNGSITSGFRRVRKLFLPAKYQHDLKMIKSAVALNFRENKLSILVNVIVFVVIAFVLNYTIDMIAYNTGLLSMLRQSGIIAEKSSEWVLLLFYKNLSVIPFTIIFETLFFCWLTGKLLQRPVLILKLSNH